jgi:hypothetical protein
MAYARKTLISVSDTPYYHVVACCTPAIAACPHPALFMLQHSSVYSVRHLPVERPQSKRPKRPREGLRGHAMQHGCVINNATLSFA